MKYIIGMDAGGTKTDSVLLAEDLQIVQSLRTPGFNVSSDGFERCLKRVEGILSEITSRFDKSNIYGIAVAAAGAGRVKEDFQQYLHEYLRNDYSAKIKVMTDAEAALEGAFAGQPGFILIAGTGSILFGKDDKGKIFRSGGYGKALGDPGSGYAIGKKAFVYLSEVIDKIKEPGILSARLCSDYKISSIHDVIKITIDSAFNFADAALDVIEAAKENDNNALHILDDEADKLCNLIKGIEKQTARNDLLLALYGSLLSNDNIYSRMIINKIKNVYPGVSIKEMEYPPAIGAAISLLKEL